METSQLVQPLVQDSVQESSQDIVQDTDNQRSTEQYRLIIVEDDALIYKTLKHIIGKHFPNVHIVGHCESVGELVSLISAEKPDIVLLDIQLRGGTSFQGLAELEERNFDCIVMSAQARFQYAQEAMRYGASEYLVKPFLPEEMIVALETVIAKRKARLSQKGIHHEPSETTFDQHEQAIIPPPLQALIVDDEKALRSVLRKKITGIFQDRISIAGEAFSVDSAIVSIQNMSPDIVFLDIDIIGGTGFDVLDAFPERTFEVIIVTSHPNFAPQAFRYEALDYILKPLEEEHIAKAVERVFASRGMKEQHAQSIAMSTAVNTEAETDDSINHINDQQFVRATVPSKKLSTETGYWAFKTTDKALHSLAWDQIIHLKADGKKTLICNTLGKPLTVAKTIQKCLEDLPDTLFYQTHRSSAINRKHFSHARDGFAFMSNGDRVSVAARIWSQFVADMIKNDRL